MTLRITSIHLTIGGLIEYIEKISGGDIKVDLIDEERIRSSSSMPDWSAYCGVMNETSLSPKELESVGVASSQLILAGNFNATQ